MLCGEMIQGSCRPMTKMRSDICSIMTQDLINYHFAAYEGFGFTDLIAAYSRG